MVNYLEKVGHGLKTGVTLIATIWIPEKPWITLAAGFAWWYGRRVAFTYGPGLVANYFINNTASFMGSATLGKIIGATIVAPALTPSIVPWVALATACVSFCLVSIICNIALRIFRHYRGTPTPAPTT